MLRSLPRQRIVIFLGLLFGAAWSQEYAPITTLDVDAYLGRWYQTHTTLGFIFLELGGLCTTADYGATSDAKISVINQSRPWLVPQFLARTTGFVVQSSDATKQGAFTVSQQYLFAPDPNVVFEAPGNYWIIGLGPIVDGEYQWAAVSTPNKSNSWILARDVDDFYDKYVDDALAVYSDFGGYDGFFNSLIPTGHFLCWY